MNIQCSLGLIVFSHESGFPSPAGALVLGWVIGHGEAILALQQSAAVRHWQCGMVPCCSMTIGTAAISGTAAC